MSDKETLVEFRAWPKISRHTGGKWQSQEAAA